MAKLICVALVVLGVYLAPSQAQDSSAIEGCVNKFMEEFMPVATSGDLTVMCPYVEKYAKCLMGTFGDMISQANMQMVESMLQNSLSQQGINCDIDLSSLASGSGSGSSGSGTGSSGSGTGSSGSGTGSSGSGMMGQSDCLKNYMESAAQVTNPSQICDLAKTMLECELNANANVNPTEEQIRQMEQGLQSMFTQAKVQCQIDVRGMLAQHQGGGGGGNNGQSVFGSAVLVSALSALFLFAWV